MARPKTFLGVWAFLAAIGAALLAAGSARVRTETTFDHQAVGIELAVAGVIVAGGGTILMLVAGRRAVGARRLALLGDVRLLPSLTSAAFERSSSERLVAGPGLRHFHRADCTMAQGRDWGAALRPEHEQAGLIACGVCRP